MVRTNKKLIKLVCCYNWLFTHHFLPRSYHPKHKSERRSTPTMWWISWTFKKWTRRVDNCVTNEVSGGGRPWDFSILLTTILPYEGTRELYKAGILSWEAQKSWRPLRMSLRFVGNVFPSLMEKVRKVNVDAFDHHWVIGRNFVKESRKCWVSVSGLDRTLNLGVKFCPD